MRPIQELKKAVLDALDADYMADAIKDLGKAVHANVEDAVNEAMEGCGYLQTCLNCKHFNEPQELCLDATPAARPPARVIAFGCPAFEDEDTVESTTQYLNSGTAPKPAERPKTGFDDLDDDIPF